MTDATIEVRVRELSQLFHTLDPFPFRERDMDKDAEAFIVAWAREFAGDRPITIIVHLPQSQAATDDARNLGDAMRRFFGYRAGLLANDQAELFRFGRTSPAIGLVVLAICLAASQALASRLGTSDLGRFVEEGLVILGWVANWKPIEILLYDWWPIFRKRQLYRRLASATVELQPHVEWTSTSFPQKAPSSSQQ